MKNLLLILLLITYSHGLNAQTWCQKADFPLSERRNTIGFSIAGKGYVCLGDTGTSLGPQISGSYFKDLVMYDPSTNTWTSKADFPGNPRRSGIAFTIDSFAYVGLGQNKSTSFYDMYRYNANSDSWKAIADYTGSASVEAMSASVKGKGYIAGGKNRFGVAQNELFEYDPVTDKYRPLFTLPFGTRTGGVMFSDDSLIYFGLGNTLSKIFWTFSPQLNAWRTIAPFPGNARINAAFFRMDNNKVVVGGGTDIFSSIPYSDYYEYDINTNIWRQVPGFADGARSRSAYFAIGNRGYVSTGLDTNSNVKNTWEYIPKYYLDTTICFGESITLDATEAFATYTWQDNSTNATFSTKNAGIYWVDVLAIGCLRRDTFEISVEPEINVKLGNDTSMCFSDSLLLDVSYTGANYLWQDSSTNSTFHAKDSGTFWVEITVGDCIKRESIKISYYSEIPLDLGSDTLMCPNSNLTLIASLPGAIYNWQDNTNLSTYLAMDSGIYWVDVTINNCIKRDSIAISYKPEFKLSKVNDTTICSNDTIHLDASIANATYQWQNNTTDSTIEVLDSGIYWVDVTFDNCIKRDSILVSYKPEIGLNLGNDTTICFGDTLLIDANIIGTSYLWNDGTKASNFSITADGLYWVDVTFNGCTKRDSINVIVLSNNFTGIGSDTALCIGESFTIGTQTSNSSYLIEWHDGSTNPNFVVSDSGLYWVNIQNKCVNISDSLYVSLKNCNCELQIPNVITPNRDNVNDYFKVNSPCTFSTFNLSIYNRWGDRIITYNNSALFWDGTINGINVEEGVYFYTVEYSDEGTSKMQKKAGIFNILR